MFFCFLQNHVIFEFVPFDVPEVCWASNMLQYAVLGPGINQSLYFTKTLFSDPLPEKRLGFPLNFNMTVNVFTVLSSFKRSSVKGLKVR